jgi:hypothetical protein
MHGEDQPASILLEDQSRIDFSLVTGPQGTLKICCHAPGYALVMFKLLGTVFKQMEITEISSYKTDNALVFFKLLGTVFKQMEMTEISSYKTDNRL